MNKEASDRKAAIEKDLESLTFRQNFIQQVIFEIRFASYLKIETEIPEIQNRLKTFPIVRNEIESGIELLVSEGRVRKVENEKISKFQDRETSPSWIITISKTRFAIEQVNNSFQRFTTFRDKFLEAWKAISDVAPVPTSLVKRIGLRYSNRFAGAELKKRNIDLVPNGLFWDRFASSSWIPADVSQEIWGCEDRISLKDQIGATIRTSYTGNVDDPFSRLDIDVYKKFEVGTVVDPTSNIEPLHRAAKLWFRMLMADKFLEALK